MTGPRRAGALAAVVVAVLAAAACSGGDGGDAPAGPDPLLVPGLTQGPEATVQEPRIGFATARRICSSASLELLAGEYGSEATETAVAAAMAAAIDAPEGLRVAVRDGCLAGFPAFPACLATWNAAGSEEPRSAAAAAGAERAAWVIGGPHTPSLDPVDGCIVIVAPAGSEPFDDEVRWQPEQIHVLVGGEWYRASPLVGDVRNPTAVVVPADDPDEARLVVYVPLEANATVEPDGALAPRG